MVWNDVVWNAVVWEIVRWHGVVGAIKCIGVWFDIVGNGIVSRNLQHGMVCLGTVLCCSTCSWHYGVPSHPSRSL